MDRAERSPHTRVSRHTKGTQSARWAERSPPLASVTLTGLRTRRERTFRMSRRMTFRMTRMPKTKLALSSWTYERSVGWGARTRTWEWRNQNPLPYHLATPQQAARCHHGARTIAARLGPINGR